MSGNVAGPRRRQNRARVKRPRSSSRLLPLAAALLLAAACQPGSPKTPPPTQGGLNLHCARGDTGEADIQLGWGFCFPATWHALGGERTQKTDVPKGIDAIFDITDYASGPTNGLFGVMYVSTDDRGSAASLAGWIDANVGTGLQLQSIKWGNAAQALREVGGQGRRFALTPHHVVILYFHSGPGNLDLESAMSARLSTWKFTY